MTKDVYDGGACLEHYMPENKDEPPGCGNCVRRTGDTCYAHSTQAPPSEAATEHTKTPWRANCGQVFSGDGGDTLDDLVALTYGEGNDVRIALAVNAHDDLVAACEMFLNGDGHGGDLAEATARAALAKAGKTTPCPDLSADSAQ